MTTLTVGVITYRRPAGLARLLPPLLVQVAAAAGAGHDAEVLVVDNDPQGSADLLCASFGVRYVTEAVPGIAAARNRVIAETAGRDLIVFIDDDEVPEDGWLAHLLRAHEVTGAHAVTGAVTSRFDVEPDDWVRAGGFFDRRHRRGLRSGADIAVAATNNLLLDRRLLDAVDLRFDEAFGLSGGSDTLFSAQLVAGGGRIVWCPEAVVVEQVPAARISRRWLLTRALSYGTTDIRVALRMAGTPRARLRARLHSVGRGLPRVGAGAARYVLGRLTGSARHQALGAQTCLRGCGQVLGTFGYSYERYKRPAARPAGGTPG